MLYFYSETLLSLVINNGILAVKNELTRIENQVILEQLTKDDVNMSHQEYTLWSKRQKIDAIKSMRERYGKTCINTYRLGLKDAKDACERYDAIKRSYWINEDIY